jgi:hypothetical protein
MIRSPVRRRPRCIGAYGPLEAERCDLERERLAPTLEGALGRRVGTDARHPTDGALARHEHDATTAGGTHRWEQGLGQPDGTEQVGGEDLLPHLNGHLLDAADPCDTGVVHDAVGRADALDDLARSRVD